jgi:hypothetical protein
LAAELLSALVAGLKPGTPEEYRRIPWIWRVSIAAGKRNEAKQVVEVLEASLPRLDEPLRDWQAVVIGGGIINGISQTGAWPGARMEELLKEKVELQKRWRRALEQASAMADQGKTPTGTRYDGLRMIALDGWDKCGEQLAKYLKKGTHAELSMGAISGVSDIDSPKVAPLLIGGLEHLSVNNRRLAVDALLRTEARAAALLEAIEKGTVKAEVLSKEQRKALTEHKSKALRERARRVLKEN